MKTSARRLRQNSISKAGRRVRPAIEMTHAPRRRYPTGLHRPIPRALQTSRKRRSPQYGRRICILRAGASTARSSPVDRGGSHEFRARKPSKTTTPTSSDTDDHVSRALRRTECHETVGADTTSRHCIRTLWIIRRRLHLDVFAWDHGIRRCSSTIRPRHDRARCARRAAGTCHRRVGRGWNSWSAAGAPTRRKPRWGHCFRGSLAAAFAAAFVVTVSVNERLIDTDRGSQARAYHHRHRSRLRDR
jgi:hypothetical protein